MEKERLRLNDKDEQRLNDALAAIIASTRRGKRKLPLLEVARKIRVAAEFLGGLSAVAETVSLSDEMVRQFMRVEKLSPSVRKLASTDALRSVDLADRLSRLPPGDQLRVAKEALDGELSIADVRAILGARKSAPQVPISKLIEHIKRSRNIKEYVVEFMVPQSVVADEVLSERLSNVLGQGSVKRVEVRDGVGRAILNKRGRLALEKGAKSAGLTKPQYLHILVRGR
jgi:hypothetical protein